MSEIIKPKLSILDADWFPYTFCYNSKDSLIDKTLKEILALIDKSIESLLVKTEAEYYILFTSPKKTFRNEFNSSYKSNRKPSEIKYLKEAKDHLFTKWKAIQVDNIEADDCCLCLEYKLKDKYEITIISPDKDVRFTEGKRYDPKHYKFIQTTKEEEDKALWTAVICGDSADGVGGIKKCGIKYAEQLYEECDCSKEGVETTIGVFRNEILSKYIDVYGEQLGIENFYITYKSLYILREYKEFTISENDLIRVENVKNDEL